MSTTSSQSQSFLRQRTIHTPSETQVMSKTKEKEQVETRTIREVVWGKTPSGQGNACPLHLLP